VGNLDSDQEAAGKRVLVVDDNPVNLKLTAHLIRKAGFVTDTAETAEAVLERLTANRPRLVVTDLQPPGMDGLALARIVKENPNGNPFPWGGSLRRILRKRRRKRGSPAANVPSPSWWTATCFLA
jgi:CheY-like chemotaxis protein